MTIKIIIEGECGDGKTILRHYIQECLRELDIKHWGTEHACLGGGKTTYDEIQIINQRRDFIKKITERVRK